ncbi:MAG: endoglucanase, partial [Devosia nanyangense]|nr:endoglucanase [Devosia nanyangense]
DGLKRIDVTTGEVKEHLTEPGYQLIGAALACVLDGKPVPADASRFAPTSYYAATLQLLALDFLRRERAQCLTEDSR